MMYVRLLVLFVLVSGCGLMQNHTPDERAQFREQLRADVREVVEAVPGALTGDWGGLAAAVTGLLGTVLLGAYGARQVRVAAHNPAPGPSQLDLAVEAALARRAVDRA